MKNIFLKSMLVAFAAVLTFSCDSSADNTEVIVPKKSILEIAKGDSNFSILVAAIKKAGLDVPGSSPLSSAGSYTVFAPTNAAFAATLPTFTEAYINGLTAPADNTTIARLKQVVLNHILSGAVKSTDLVNDSYVKTFAQYNNSSTTLSMYVRTVGGVKINGGSELVGTNGANVTSADMLANNGILHVVDKVLLPQTILNHAVANPSLTQLVSLVTSTDTATPVGDQSAVKTVLENATQGSNAHTIFAPTNDAFTAALAGFLSGAAVTPANVTKVLQYHVEKANRVSSSATAFTAATSATDLEVLTLSTQKFLVTKGTLKITELPAVSTIPASNIKTVNIQGINGSLHIIDRVLKPVF
jgi:uncharacterized surface protein with fasciclin (FAS1) repeats